MPKYLPGARVLIIDPSHHLYNKTASVLFGYVDVDNFIQIMVDDVGIISIQVHRIEKLK